jgi:Holliday junction resolvasome RuvABC endonuclease subunit
MRILAFDPGAKRCGFAVLEESAAKPTFLYITSGISGIERGEKEAYQEYRLRLVEFWVVEAANLLAQYEPDHIIAEIVPAVGGGNFVVATQSQLALCVVTTIQSIAVTQGIEFSQVAAGKVKRNIGGVKDASKIKVRNRVLEVFPDLANRKKDWIKVFDETDAISIALYKLGYKA